MEQLYYSIDLEVNRNCNQQCFFCSIKTNCNKIFILNSIDNFLKVIKKPIRLWITGGEPLLVPYVPQIKKYLANFNIQNIGINTNGTLIKPIIANRLINNYNTIIISIDGSEQIHDFIRGKIGAFQKSINGLKMLIAAKTKKQLNTIIGVNTVITKSSINGIINLFESLISIGVDIIKFSPVVYDFNSRIYKNYGLKPEHSIMLKKIYDFLKEEKKIAPWFTENSLNRMINYVNRIPDPPHFCGTGKNFIFIDSKGNIYPCYRIRSERFKTFNIEDKISINKITDTMKKVREYKNSSCNFCLHL